MRASNRGAAIAKTLPQWIHDLLASPPHAGDGVHNWLFRVAKALHPYRDLNSIEQVLVASVAGCGRTVTPKEIKDAIENSKAMAWMPGQHYALSKPPAWPSINQEQREALVRDGGGLADLWEASPTRFEDNQNHCEHIIDALFPGNPLLCVGQSSREFSSRTRESLRGKLSDLALIVPNPMSAQTGRTKEGKESEHSLDNTGPRRFLIVEFDSGPEDEHAAILLHLMAKQAPLALAVHSGGKSLHGWFFCAGKSEERLREFMRYAVSLGADSTTWCRSQFVRMPDGTRDNGKRQTVFFFDPGVIK